MCAVPHILWQDDSTFASPSDTLAGHFHVIVLSRLEDPHKFDIFDLHKRFEDPKEIVEHFNISLSAHTPKRQTTWWCFLKTSLSSAWKHGNHNIVRVIFWCQTIQAYGSCCFGQGGSLAANCLRDQRGSACGKWSSKFLDSSEIFSNELFQLVSNQVLLFLATTQ